ncbi:Putative F0F1-ATPase subunit (ATPase_gene1) [Desulfosporosinus acidiphilus SJ4]|uniref:Putative F0F1-ATPase subunit (ATPase_gene1) n=1 Tax=Desulfosporosinus acidiphilus (strain DSM 22704 / JCM 16185 / SJ4) TaxID=646529 RepID=I4DCE4_DESAJ|nr:AtpZ/AtpI family protein [Desulfosporosinus acidiphilus]AFM43468.1 Putative F0F1-ATPase subunit (ATPase_gene1) [Desulfosporosinus acidiphilus SJ4]
MAGNLKAWQKALAIGSSIATTLAGLVGGGFFLGRYLDARWDTQPILTIGLMLTGLVLGASYLVITLKEWMTDDKK